MSLHDIEAIVLDMDGVLRCGMSPISGADETVRRFIDLGYKVMIVTNECRWTPAELSEQLFEIGLPEAAKLPIYTAGLAARDYLLTSSASRYIGVIGETGLHRVLTHPDLTVVSTPPRSKECTLVIGTKTGQLKRGDSQNICEWLDAGADVVLTCDDKDDPSEDSMTMPRALLRQSSGSGEEIAAIASGKPHSRVATAIKRQFNHQFNSNQILFVGDTVHTDIRFAVESGFKSVLVLSGNSPPVKMDWYPNEIVPKLEDVIDLLVQKSELSE